MSKISILPESLTNKIAAGEVIERPASIVRELLDNSIDAGGKNISVDILYGGKKLIRVSDDGSGMDRDDAVLCLERHSTSKIKSEDDLFNIKTLGFRGEALSSVASISKVALVTSTSGSNTGTKIEIGAGQKKDITDAPPSPGTVIEIRDIFYNTPARRKFLKSNPTELSHIIGAVTQKALAYPEISFLLKNNNNELINVSAAADIKERFIQLYTEEMFNEFFEVKQQGNHIQIYGFSSSVAFTRSNRSYQFIFMNRRSVRNPTVSHAVYSAYGDLIPKGRNPAYFLFLDIDPLKVDVNVHPAKREVRFENPDDIHRFVAHAVREGLRPKKEKGAVYSATAGSSVYKDIKRVAGRPGDWSVREMLESAVKSAGTGQADFFDGSALPRINNYIHIGDAFALEVTRDGLTIIDRHAAHERVLYERLLKKTSLEIKNLILPIRVELPAKEFNIIMSYKDIFHDFGLDIEDFGSNNVIVRAMPEEFNKADMNGLLLDIASSILEQETTGSRDETGKQNLLKNIAASLACHKSVRGSEPLNDEELTLLISDLESTEMPDMCPHGRPTRIALSLDDLRKMFKRK